MGTGSAKIQGYRVRHPVGMKTSVESCEGVCKQCDLLPDSIERLVRRTETTLQVDQRTAVFRKFIVHPFQYIVGQHEQFIRVVFGIIPIQQIERKKKIEILGHWAWR